MINGNHLKRDWLATYHKLSATSTSTDQGNEYGIE